MVKLVIEGGRKLEGKIKVAGDKNSTLPILAATILIKGRIILENVSRIQDVAAMLAILKFLGVESEWKNEHTLVLNTEKSHYEDLLIEEIKKLRASIVFLGSVLARFGKIKISQPGGDVIGARPLETHLEGLADLGVEAQDGESISGVFKKLKNNIVTLKEASVTGTETLMLFCALQSKPITLRLCATEPSVQALGWFLQKLGVEIKGLGTPFLTMKGARQLKRSVKFTLPPDPTEAATFVALAGATRSKIEIEEAPLEFLDSLFLVMAEMAFRFKVSGGKLHRGKIFVYPSNLKGAKIQTGLYPKFLSDMQPPFGVAATQAHGVTIIHDWLYENRFGHLRELARMGANTEILDPHRALIIGPTPLHGGEVRSLDIRAGIALVIAGLIAKGTTVIYEAEKIDRGYEKLEERLQRLGAVIEKKE